MSLSDYLTPKQLEVLHTYLHDDFDMLVLTGAIRSGKTFIDNLLFLFELRRVTQMAKDNHDKHPQYILAGASSDTINKNVIISCENQFGINFKLDRHGHYSLFGVDITPVSTKTLGGLAGARGFTAYGAYVNETTLGVEPVFQEIQQRCSIEGARIIADTNPDNPEHWFKKDYLDNDNPRTKMIQFHFTIDDNTHLSKRYIEGIKARTPSGMYYDRAILGLWVTGEGAVYKDFDERRMVVDNVPPMDKYVAGVDWGYQHYGSIVVFGIDKDDKWYLVEEHSEQYKEIDYWTKIAHELRQKYGRNMPFYCDTARTEHIDHFKHSGINALYGWKSVVPGIEIVASLMKQGRFFVEKKAPVRFLDEIYNYQWDDKNEDAVVKENDDCMDACRYAIASYLHTKERKTYHPESNNRQGIMEGMRRFGL
ncbi:MAG TPA: PBSX family phage terminase large subunit [Candidatus Limosilactobacillus intestinavium]|nr:PBSX family phage terminase large subunit [Candidatus Limosilactobacillus intestinavium]